MPHRSPSSVASRPPRAGGSFVGPSCLIAALLAVPSTVGAQEPVASAVIVTAPASARVSATVATAALVPPSAPLRVSAPAATRGERGLYLTVFRSPSSGLELRRGRLSLHGGYYPTILKADGEAEGRNTDFLRLGLTVYSSPRGRAVFLSPSLVVNLDGDERFDDGILTELGARLPVAGPASLRLGAGLLTTFDGEVRLNPTIGMDVRLGGRR